MKLIYLIFLIGSGVFYIEYADNLSAITFLIVLCIPIFMEIIVTWVHFHIKVELRALSTIANKDDDITIQIIIQNKSGFSIPNAAAEICYWNSYQKKHEYAKINIPISGKNTQCITAKLSSQYCGRLFIKLKSVKIFDYLKWFYQSKRVNQVVEITVLPQPYFIDATFSNNNNLSCEGDTYSKYKSGDDPSEVFDIREYRAGDKPNRIHWKLSSKSEELLVKEHSHLINSTVLFLLEFSTAPHEKSLVKILDTMLETVMSISEFMLEERVVHSIAWYNGKMLIIEKISTQEDLAVALNKLFAVAPHVNMQHAYDNFIKVQDENNYSHVVYFTPQLPEGFCKSFSDNVQAELLSIFHIGDFSKAEENKTELIPSEAEVINIQIGAIQESINDFII